MEFDGQEGVGSDLRVLVLSISIWAGSLALVACAGILLRFAH